MHADVQSGTAKEESLAHLGVHAQQEKREYAQELAGIDAPVSLIQDMRMQSVMYMQFDHAVRWPALNVTQLSGVPFMSNCEPYCCKQVMSRLSIMPCHQLCEPNNAAHCLLPLKSFGLTHKTALALLRKLMHRDALVCVGEDTGNHDVDTWLDFVHLWYASIHSGVAHMLMCSKCMKHAVCQILPIEPWHVCIVWQA